VNLAQANIVLRPRELGEVLDLACRVCASSLAGLYIRLFALILLPCAGVCLLLHYLLGLPWWAVWLTAWLLGSFAQGVFTVATGRFLFAESLTVREVLRSFRERVWSYFGAVFITRIYVGLSALLVFLLPFAVMRTMFVHEASLLEMAGARTAVRRANRFVAGRGARAFEISAALLIAQLAIILVGELMGDGVVNGLLQLGKPFGVLWKNGGSVYALLGFFASVPFIATARFLFYIDRRTRTDGWDIQLKFMAVAADAGRSRMAA